VTSPKSSDEANEAPDVHPGLCCCADSSPVAVSQFDIASRLGIIEGMSRNSLNVSLTPQLEQFITARVASGRFQSASEVVRAALRMLEDSESERQAALRKVRKQIAVGIDQLDHGEWVDGEAVFKEIAVLSAARRGRQKAKH
jgi:antitoxin ParD1/3/4